MQKTMFYKNNEDRDNTVTGSRFYLLPLIRYINLCVWFYFFLFFFRCNCFSWTVLRVQSPKALIQCEWIIWWMPIFTSLFYFYLQGSPLSVWTGTSPWVLRRRTSTSVPVSQTSTAWRVRTTATPPRGSG